MQNSLSQTEPNSPTSSMSWEFVQEFRFQDDRRGEGILLNDNLSHEVSEDNRFNSKDLCHQQLQLPFVDRIIFRQKCIKVRGSILGSVGALSDVRISKLTRKMVFILSPTFHRHFNE